MLMPLHSSARFFFDALNLDDSGEALEDKRGLLVAGLRPLLTDPNLKVRRTLAQVIVAMAHHDYLSLDGGDTLVKFIIQQCSVPDGVSP